MKQVNPNTVRARIQQLERAQRFVGLSLHEEFELKCARALLSYMTDGAE